MLTSNGKSYRQAAAVLRGGIMARRIFQFFGITLVLMLGSNSAAPAQELSREAHGSTSALIRVACDPEAPSDLRAFKQRQITRRQAYLEQTMAAMRTDSLANADAYTPDDRKDLTETLQRLRTELGEVRAFVSSGCSSVLSAEPAGVKTAVPPYSTSKSAPRSPAPKAIATPAGAAPEHRTLPENPVPKVFSASSASAPAPSPGATRSSGAPVQDSGGDSASGSDAKQLQQQVKEIQDSLSKQDQDFALVLGLGSLVINPHASDYKNDSNVIHTTNLGSATPQLLTGVAFRSHVPSLTFRWHGWGICDPPKEDECAEAWKVRPWSGFVSLKFAPGSSQILNGYVIGGTYSITKHLDALIGFALTPVNEASPGFRVAASQFVANQQKLGLDLNFDPNAMLANKRNAFDGFPVTDPTGKLIYQGNPLTVHYRGGAVFGVSFPIYFRSSFKP
jgi:hypothetical protein